MGEKLSGIYSMICSTNGTSAIRAFLPWNKKSPTTMDDFFEVEGRGGGIEVRIGLVCYLE